MGRLFFVPRSQRARARRSQLHAERGIRIPGRRCTLEGDRGGKSPSARLEGMITDPMYEGKSMQGIIELVQKGFSPTDRKCFMRILAALLPLTAIAIYSATVKGVLS